jgi:quercetin dioxygenase-like cupin family protein
MTQFGSIASTPLDTSMSRYFTGKVEIRRMVGEPTSKEVELFLVSFFNGARTKLHYHESDQILLATSGHGIISAQTAVKNVEESGAQVEFGESKQMREGDYVCIPAGTWHWHGAMKGQAFSHLQSKRPGRTVWLEE